MGQQFLKVRSDRPGGGENEVEPKCTMLLWLVAVVLCAASVMSM